MKIDLRSCDKFFEGLDEGEALSSYRKSFLRKFDDEFEFPKFRYSSFVKMNLPRMTLDNINPIPDSELKVDADEEIKVYGKMDDELLEKYVKTLDIFDGRSLMDDLHSALMNKYIFVEIPDDHVSSKPIVLELDAGEDASFVSVYLIGGINSVSKVIIKRRSSDKCPFVSYRFNLILGSGANMNLIDVQAMSHNTVTIERSSLHTEKSSILKTSSMCLGAKYAKSDFFSELDGDGSSSELRILSLTTGNRRHNIHSESRHNAPSTYSDILTKGVISDRSKALATGNVCIRENASSSSGYETQNALILSDTAEADAIPNLEIHNHDVTCSHGSTISQVDEEQVFYMMSRGVKRKNAEVLIVKGFFNDLLDQIRDEEISQSVYDEIEGALTRKYE